MVDDTELHIRLRSFSELLERVKQLPTLEEKVSEARADLRLAKEALVEAEAELAAAEAEFQQLEKDINKMALVVERSVCESARIEGLLDGFGVPKQADGKDLPLFVRVLKAINVAAKGN